MAIIKTFFTQPEISPKDIFIIGAGTFGKKALERLSSKYPTSHITIVDRSEEALSNLSRNNPYSASFRIIKGDGVETIVQNKKIIQPETWVIPAIPVHVASEWIVRKLMYKGYNLNPAPIPEDLQTKLPNPFIMAGRNDLLFISVASFICPDNCPEPPEKCTHTGKPRTGNLYEMIADAIPEPWSALVFRSFQLSPGVGGYPALYLMEGLKTLEELGLSIPNQRVGLIPRNAGHPLIIATACRCHGVVSALTLHFS